MTNTWSPKAVPKKNSATKVQKYNYNGKSYCQNKGKYENFRKCIARREDCVFYETIKKSDGTMVGICRPRYAAKKKARDAKREADIQNTQNLSMYNGRRND